MFLVIKYAGAAHLVYVGVQMWRSAAKRVALGSGKDATDGTKFRLFTGGFSVAMSNPKAIAFLPHCSREFLSPSGNCIAQLATMVVLVGLSAVFVAACYGCLGAWIRGMDLSRRVMGSVYKTTGGMFVASGLGLAASSARN